VPGKGRAFPRAAMAVIVAMPAAASEWSTGDGMMRVVVTILLLSHVTLLVAIFVICYLLFVSMQYGTTSVVDIYFSLFAMFTDFYDVLYHSI